MKQVAKYALVGAVVGTFGLFGATESEAQACVGFPTTGGQMAFAVTANFPTGGNMFGGEYGYNLPGPLSAFVGLVYTDPDDGDSRIQTVFPSRSGLVSGRHWRLVKQASV
jgi:hypothetical protein